MRRWGGPLVFVVLCLILSPVPARALAPNDPLFDQSPDPASVNEQWNLMSDGRGISADTAWDTTKGEGVVIASIDTGLDFTHEDLANQTWTNPGETGGGKESNGVDDDGNGYVDDWRGWDFYQDDNDPSDGASYGHGTGTAGIAVAEQDNGVGISGVAPGAKVMVLRTSDTYIQRSDRIARAIHYATDNGARVVTMSLGAISDSSFLRQAAAYAESHGVVLVAAMANEFSTHPNVPTIEDQVLGVGAIVPNTDGQDGVVTARDFTVKGAYSNYGVLTDVVAPSSVFTTRLGGGYGKGGGTSSATPHAAGVAALVLSAADARGLNLSAREVVSILRASADDLVGGPYGYAQGWDRYTGWGRLDAAAAVAMAAPGKVPPVADIDTPRQLSYHSGDITVRGTVSARSGPYHWTLSIGHGEEPASFSKIAEGTPTTPTTGPLATFSKSLLLPGLNTLLLRVTDANGNTGEDRQVFSFERDGSVLKGFRKQLGASVSSGPQVVNLDGRGGPEIVLADGDGYVHAFSRGGRELTGWPVSMPEVTSHGQQYRVGFSSAPAVADLDVDGRLDVVIGGLDGTEYAWDARGQPLPGWPVPTKVPSGPDPDNQFWESMTISPAAVADLDGEPGLEAVQGAGDGKVYAWHADGSPVTGWPVLLDDPAVPGVQVNKLVSSPAVADLDGDGSVEVVIGSEEHYPGFGRVWALEADGTARPGWPVPLAERSSSGVPLVATGVPESPVLADVDGDGTLEIGITGFTGGYHLFEADGSETPSPYFRTTPFGPRSNSFEPDAQETAANLAFGDLDRDGTPDLVSGGAGLNLLVASLRAGRVQPFDHLAMAWDGKTGRFFPAWPRVIEDWMFLTAPILADVDGDGRPEVILGSGVGVVHAFRLDGHEPAGWPKPTFQWVQASAAAGDLDGDGHTDIAVATRSGMLLAFRTTGVRRGLDWPMGRHDPANTGVFRP